MRPALLARVFVFGALTAGLLHPEATSQAQAKGGSRQTPPAFTPISKIVTGEPTASKESAIQSAFKKTKDEIAQELKLPADQLPESITNSCLANLDEKEEPGWREDQLNGKRILVRKDTFEDAELVREAYTVRLRVEVSEKEFAAIRKIVEQAQEELRREVVQHRQWWVAKFLLGVVVLLGSLSGYIRLEDATKGYYTGLLRLGMIGVLCAVGAGLWLAA